MAPKKKNETQKKSEKPTDETDQIKGDEEMARKMQSEEMGGIYKPEKKKKKTRDSETQTDEMVWELPFETGVWRFMSWGDVRFDDSDQVNWRWIANRDLPQDD